MRVPDRNLAEVWDQGFTVVEGFLDADTLAAAQDALWGLYPRPADYFAAPQTWPDFAKSQFAGLRFFPYDDWALNRLPVYPDLVDAAERFVGSQDIEVYKVELWAKYSGATNYDQAHHRDFGNHTLVVPRADGRHVQMTTILLLSDVTEQDGPTRLVPTQHTGDLPLIPKQQPMGALCDREVAATGPAGSLLIWKTDVLHRGSDFGAPGRSRFVMLCDFTQRGWPWNGKMSWPDRANRPAMGEALTRMTPRERCLFGFPPPQSDYWNDQTRRDVALRYPGMDMRPYA
jgi:hypothetical protein